MNLLMTDARKIELWEILAEGTVRVNLLEAGRANL